MLLIPDYFDKHCVTSLVNMLLNTMNFRRVAVIQVSRPFLRYITTDKLVRKGMLPAWGSVIRPPALSTSAQ